MKYIQAMDGLTPSEYAHYLDGQKAWASNILSAANVIYQNGKNSHDVARQVYNEATDAKHDLDLEYGLFDTTGNIAGYKHSN